MLNVICYYHKNCYDGSASAAAVLRAFPDATLIAVNYGDPIYYEGLTDAVVYVVDFSFPQEVILEMVKYVRRLVILDHHRTFRETALRIKELNDTGEFGADLVEIVYDESRSGALISWQYFFPHEEVPLLVQHISDRDLWQFKLPYTRQITMALGMLSNDPEEYLKLILSGNDTYQQLIVEGTVLTRKLEMDIENTIKNTLREVEFDGRVIPVVNCPYNLASETLSRLADKYGLAVSYYDGKEDRIYSVRSKGEGHGLSEPLAKRFGGGGHPDAAGWRVKRTESFYKGNLAAFEETLQLAKVKVAKDQAYTERNYVVSALAKAYPSGKRPTVIEGWNPEWNNCVYIQLPTGQISYHYHDNLKELFDWLPDHTLPYDGHHKETVHQRLKDLGVGPYRGYLETYIQEHRYITTSGNPDLRADEIANITMWCDKLEKYIMSVQIAFETGTHPKLYWK